MTAVYCSSRRQGRTSKIVEKELATPVGVAAMGMVLVAVMVPAAAVMARVVMAQVTVVKVAEEADKFSSD